MQTMNFNVGTDHRGLVSDVQNFKIGNDARNWVQARQFEGEMRTVVVNVMEGTIPLNLTGTTIWFEGLMSDGKTRIIDAKHGTILSPSTGQFRFEFPYAAFATFGSYKQSFFKIVRDGKSIATLEFTLDVLVNLVEDGLVPLDYITPFQDLYEKLDIIYQNADADIKARVIEWQQKVTELITSLNGDYAAIQLTVNGLNEKLDSVSKQIEAGGLVTHEDFGPIKNEIETARGEHASLDERLGQFISEQDLEIGGDNYNDVDGGIRDYFVKPLNKIKAGIKTGDPSIFNLGFGTDYHYDSASDFQLYDNSPEAKEKAVEQMNQGLRKSLNILSLSDSLDALVFNGDNADQPTEFNLPRQRILMYKQEQDFANTAFSIAKCPVFLLKGNHDNNYNMKHDDMNLTNVLHDADFKKLYWQNGSQGEVRKGNNNYFYRDFPEKNIRLIGLDTSDSPEATDGDGVLIYDRFHNSYLQQTQLDWLANVALQNVGDMTVVITLHFSVNKTVGTREDNTMINHDLLKTILADFAKGNVSNKTITSTGAIPAVVTYSFSTSGNIAGVLGGHYHYDNYKKVDGINYILTRCSLIMGDNVLKEKRLEYDGTALEDAFDIFSIDTSNRTISTVRFGAGSEDSKYATRSYTY